MTRLLAHNVSEALWLGLRYLSHEGVRSESRNGPVTVAPGPVLTVSLDPRRRVLHVPARKENPLFHLVEALWMLAGRNDLRTLSEIVPRFKDFSDDGKTVPGAYGFRWRKQFNGDQLDWAVGRLSRDPNDRRVVISMWDGYDDPDSADAGSRDVPCNTQIYLLVRDGRLDLTVTCRSNDAIWGAHGANAVHFSILQEYLAARIGVGVGTMYQFSNNYHAYDTTFSPELRSWAEGPRPDAGRSYSPRALFDPGERTESWDEDLAMWWEDPLKVGLRHSFFRRVATPMLMMSRAVRAKDRDAARDLVEQIACSDWYEASLRYFHRSFPDV